MTQRILLPAVGLLLVASFAQAQLVEAPLSQRIDGAQIIVEGVVVESTPFYDPERTLIYTAHRLSIDKIFKHSGSPATGLREILLVTPGGQIDDEWHVVQPSLELEPGLRGIFFVDARPGYAGRPGAHVPYAGKQGFVRYDGKPGLARDVFARYGDIVTELYEPIQQRLGRPYVVLGLFDPGRASRTRAITSHSISGFTPGTVRAGIQEVLTLDGSGFGAFSGSAAVLFDDANDGLDGNFGTADAAHIVSWSDTQIQVQVPNRLSGIAAGSGLIAVRNAAGEDAFSADTLTVDYGLNEILRTDPAVELFRIGLRDQNQIGGYTFKYGTGTASGGVDFTSVPDAVARFEEGLTEWNCATGWNGIANGTTTVTATANDGVNLVAFDNDADPLPAFVLGRTANFFARNCVGDTWHVSGSDIRFKRDGQDGTAWYYGADASGLAVSETDFASVALHELGHAVGHSHVNDPSDLMYFRLTPGTSTRSLSAGNVAGGFEILNFSTGFTDCTGITGMAAFDCTVHPTADFIADPLGTCGKGLTVDFSDLSLNGPTSWSWDFGDTGTSTERNPVHDYTAQGLYSVSLAVTNGNGGDALNRGNYIVVTDDPATASCNPTFTDHNPGYSLGIRNVTLNSIDVTTDTPGQGDPLQEDFSCSAFTVLDLGASYPISVTTGPFNPENLSVYVDWDGNGTLAAGELAFVSGPILGTHTGSVSVPGSAVTGTALRMRVLSDLSAINDACDNIEFGQVEDYSVLVSAPPVSPGAVPETSLTLDKGAAAGDVNLSWGASCSAAATDYTVHEGTVGSYYSHASAVCSTAGATSLDDLTPLAGDRYFIVVPVSASDEGSYGRDSTPAERPVSTAICRATQDLTACP